MKGGRFYKNTLSANGRTVIAVAAPLNVPGLRQSISLRRLQHGAMSRHNQSEPMQLTVRVPVEFLLRAANGECRPRGSRRLDLEA